MTITRTLSESVSALSTASTLDGTELIPVVQGGASKKVAVKELLGSPWNIGTTQAAIAAAAAGAISDSASYLATQGYYAVGDGGGARYRWQSSAPGHALMFADAGTRGGFWVWADNRLDIRMHGAKADARYTGSTWVGTDNAHIIQDCLDAHIYFNVAGEVFVPSGRFLISKTIHLGYGHRGFTAGRLVGVGASGWAELGGSAIIANFSDGPAIASQGGRRNTVRGIALRGVNFEWIRDKKLGIYGTAPHLDDLDPANWVDPALHANADSRYAPYAAIAIDPYSGVRPASSYPDVAYPRFLGAVSQYGKTTSSVTVIEDCHISGFVVAVVNQPNNSDGNGDFTTLQNCGIDSCKYVFSVCNTQARNSMVTNCQVVRIHTCFTNTTHGKQLGRFGSVIQNIAVGETIQLFKFNNISYAGPLTFANCYAESLWRIGEFAGASASETPIIFHNCHFEFHIQNDVRGIPAKLLGSANQVTQVKFVGGALNNFPSVVVIDQYTVGLEIDGTSIEPSSKRTQAFEQFAHNALCGGLAVTYLGANRPSTPRIRPKYLPYNLDTGAFLNVTILGIAYPSKRDRCTPIYAYRHVESAMPDGEGVFVPRRITLLDKKTLTGVSLKNKTLTFSMRASYSEAEFMKNGPLPGDVLMDNETGSIFFVKNRTGLEIVAELQNNYRADRSGGFIPVARIDLTSGTMAVANSRLFTPEYYLRGDITHASAIITNAARDDGYSQFIESNISVGDYLYIDEERDRIMGQASGKVTACSNSGSITLAGTAERSQTRRRLATFIRKPPANI
jgi:hypothetical protein